MIINAYCRDKGWLFEDFKHHFESYWLRDGQVIATETPDPFADAWVSIRSSEIELSPDLSRTVAQIHCQQPHLIGDPWVCEALSKVGALSFTHYEQPKILRQMGVQLDGKPVLLRPVGALEAFELRDQLPGTFTVGWSGRNTGAKGLDLFVDAVVLASEEVGLKVRLIGEQLEDVESRLVDRGIRTELYRRALYPIEKYPELYAGLDVLLITSESEAGPLPLFEALACGVPVISSSVGWAERLIDDGETGALCMRLASCMAQQIENIYRNRADWFERRHLIRASLMGFTLEDWITENINLARSLLE